MKIVDLSNSVHVKIGERFESRRISHVETLLAWDGGRQMKPTGEEMMARTLSGGRPKNIKTIKSSSVIVFGVLLLWIIR